MFAEEKSWTQSKRFSGISQHYLWVRIKGEANKAVVGVHYRPLSQDDNNEGLFFKELRDISRSAVLVLMGDFNFPDINWEYQKADTNRSRKFIKHSDKFLVQVLREPAKKDALLDGFVNREGLVSEVAMGSPLGHHDHEVVKYEIFGDRR